MNSAILAVAAVAGLACPLHMWWQHRLGVQGACGSSAERSDSVAALTRRQAALADQLRGLQQERTIDLPNAAERRANP